jgi:hypothetical protein
VQPDVFGAQRNNRGPRHIVWVDRRGTQSRALEEPLEVLRARTDAVVGHAEVMAELHVVRSAVTSPAPGKPSEADATGTLQLHGVSRPCSIHYRVEQGQPGEYRVHGTTRIDIRDFGIEVPAWGVRVDPSVGIQVDFTVRDA